MPYINQLVKDQLKERFACSAGELNYKLTNEINNYIKNVGKNYWTLNDVIGALECCKQEFYRRVVIPYEDEKIKQNGDVYNV